jgi:hypothetical protein
MLLSGLLGTIVATVARPHPQEKADELSESQVLAMIRMVNTLQVVAHEEDQRHQYASLDVLVYRRHQNHELWLPNLHLTDSSTGTLKNYTVSVVVSADGQHYVAEMIGSGCALALFSNESAVIYTARGLGCPEEKPSRKDL